MRKSIFCAAVCAGGMAAAPAASAALINYFVTMTGDQEVPGPGDSSGFASGTFTFDTTANTVSWNVSYSGLVDVNDSADLQGFHIHVGGVGVAGAIVIDLGLGTSGGFGTLDGMTNISSTLMLNIITNETGYYANLHTTIYPNGAVRGQLPTPGAAVTLLAGMALVTRRRR